MKKTTKFEFQVLFTLQSWSKLCLVCIIKIVFARIKERVEEVLINNKCCLEEVVEYA